MYFDAPFGLKTVLHDVPDAASRVDPITLTPTRCFMLRCRRRGERSVPLGRVAIVSFDDRSAAYNPQKRKSFRGDKSNVCADNAPRILFPMTRVLAGR